MRGGAAFEAAIGHEPLEYEPGTQSVYSDPGFILLGRILERAGGAQLDAQFTTWLRTNIGGEPAVLFNPTADAIERIAPTEQDPWRSRLLRGEVHDENAAALDGVAGHGEAAIGHATHAAHFRRTTHAAPLSHQSLYFEPSSAVPPLSERTSNTF